MMTAYFGHLIVTVALLLALAGSAAGFLAVPLGQARLEQWARAAAMAVLGLVAAAVGIMEYALLTHDFSVKFVYDVGNRSIPLYQTVISLWGALEGSILFWALLLSLYTAAFLWWAQRGRVVLSGPVSGVLLAISSFFLFVIAGPGNPFQPVSPVPGDGQGLNPLLQNHWMMGVHPVLIYLGYVGLSVPFAVAIAALIDGVPDASTLRVIRRWALVPWIFLSLGIVAGMWWAYAVLGWGGYWSWDPVENASLMPWLVATAFLHSLQVQERRGMLKTWTLTLIVASFVLSIFGTFLTRSGVLQSVHSFTASDVGPVFLAFFALVLIGSFWLIVVRSPELEAPGALESTVCRETVFLLNNLFLVAITFTVLLGTIFPLIAEAVQGAQVSVGSPYFNQVVVPAGFALLFLMGVGPVLPWGAGRLEELQYRLLGPVAIGCGTVLLLLVVGVRGIGALVTFGVSAFVLAVTVGRVMADVRTRMGNTREGRAAATRRLLTANPRRYGGYLAHIGVILIVIGIAGSQAYSVRASATLHRGQSMSIDGYRLSFMGWRAHPESDRMVFGASTHVSRAGRSLGDYDPSQNIYFSSGQSVPSPAVREEPLDLLLGALSGRNPLPDLGEILHGRNPIEDVYVVLEAENGVRANNVNNPRSTATLQVIVNPLIGCIWLGGGLTGLGGFAALLPAYRRRRAVVEEPSPARIGAAEEVIA